MSRRASSAAHASCASSSTASRTISLSPSRPTMLAPPPWSVTEAFRLSPKPGDTSPPSSERSACLPRLPQVRSPLLKIPGPVSNGPLQSPLRKMGNRSLLSEPNPFGLYFSGRESALLPLLPCAHTESHAPLSASSGPTAHTFTPAHTQPRPAEIRIPLSARERDKNPGGGGTESGRSDSFAAPNESESRRDRILSPPPREGAVKAHVVSPALAPGPRLLRSPHDCAAPQALAERAASLALPASVGSESERNLFRPVPAHWNLPENRPSHPR